MKLINKLLFLFLFSYIILFCAACTSDKGLILFNVQPITKENALHDQKSFISGQKVFYLFIAPKKMQNEFIRVQVFKMVDNAPWGGNDVVRTKDYRLMTNERYYHTDYFTFYEKGRYVMQIFSHDDFQHPLAVNYFYIN